MSAENPHDLSEQESLLIKSLNNSVDKKCPSCSGVLFKKPKQAEDVSTCSECGNTWLILL